MKTTMKTIKQWLAFILTALVVVFLFGIIFIVTDLVKPTPSFFLELAAVLTLTILMKTWWYDFAEDKRLSEEDIEQEKEKYFKIVDETIKDSNDLDKFLIILNKENRDNFIKNKIGCRTATNLGKKNWLLCVLHPSWKKLTKEEIGQIRYNNLYFKIQRKADKLRQVKSEEIMALSDSDMLYDSKNHLKAKKRAFQVTTTITSFLLTTLLASIAMKEILLNWTNVFRFVGYLCSMAWTIAYTVIRAYKQTGDETIDYFNRLKFIIDKYATYKEKGGSVNGSN